MSSYDVVRLHLITPMDIWRHSTPFFGGAAFCTTKIGNFRRLPSQSFSTLVLVNFVVFLLPCLFCMFQSCVLGAHLMQLCCDFFVKGQPSEWNRPIFALFLCQSKLLAYESINKFCLNGGGGQPTKFWIHNNKTLCTVKFIILLETHIIGNFLSFFICIQSKFFWLV